MRPYLLAAFLLVVAASPGLTESLPKPLTLEAALELADLSHPDIELSAAALDTANAELLAEDARTGTRVSLNSRLRVIEPSHRALDQDQNDSSIDLTLRKQLMDFGYTEARQDAASRRIEGQEWQLVSARQEQQIEIMRRYFNVLNTDMTYLWNDEATSLAGFRFRQARDQNELGQLSDVELLELESRYQATRQQRSLTESRQRETRAQLAIALNRPGDLPEELQMPADPPFQVPLPEVKSLQQEALANNPQLKHLVAQRDAAEQRVRAAAMSYGPVLHGELDAALYNRVTGSTHPLAAGLLLEIPLTSGGQIDAEKAKAQADLRLAQAKLDKAKLRIEQEVLDLWLELGDLALKLETIKYRADYRELSLDRARTRFELEIDADIGDAMVEISSLLKDRAQLVTRWYLAEAKLKALRGRLLEPAHADKGAIHEG